MICYKNVKLQYSLSCVLNLFGSYLIRLNSQSCKQKIQLVSGFNITSDLSDVSNNTFCPDMTEDRSRFRLEYMLTRPIFLWFPAAPQRTYTWVQ